ncbi:putative YigZ family protein [Rhizobium mesoamericanum]|uniref:IMPACT family protein n=1 Tax=Rhizobium mesoamericanum TaxID=1079800 RepID=UPI00277E1F1C|nr:YigZ family protein [Rhizobium mesoamericanum]MDQ0559840.1 putative YigZ family protein [Rhizobium mesoamericanum]
MYSLERPISLEQIVKKSRFLAVAVPIASELEAKQALAAHSQGDANHNCWAWRIGQTYRFGDDGEPSGTAGKPILQAIDGQSLDKVIVIVARWFGGVLLGTGGLIRAYGGTAAACLRAGELVELVPTLEGTISAAFSDLAIIKARLIAFEGVQVLSETFTGAGAEITASFPEAKSEEVARLIADTTSGRSALALKQ